MWPLPIQAMQATQDDIHMGEHNHQSEATEFTDMPMPGLLLAARAAETATKNSPRPRIFPLKLRNEKRMNPYKITKNTRPNSTKIGSLAIRQQRQMRLNTTTKEVTDEGEPMTTRPQVRPVGYEAHGRLVVTGKYITEAGERMDVDRRDGGIESGISRDKKMLEDTGAAERLGALMREMSLGQKEETEYQGAEEQMLVNGFHKMDIDED